ncbi:MAG: GNAT family N-acetyltransferase, partial [Eudoraea sp.]|nr:GNAT family N-acetyltransferase [Eudoraea sp.]
LVHIRPLLDADFEALFNAASDALIWEQHQDKERHTLKGFTQFFNESMASGGALCILDGNSNKIIGSSRFKIIDRDNKVIEIGWTFLQRRYWGGIHNLEVKKLMIDHALQSFKYVVFYVHENNRRSRKALEKIGAVRAMDYQLPWVLDQSEGVTYLIDKKFSG